VLWTKDSKEALAVRKLAYESHESYETYRSYIKERSSGTAANIVVCLIHQTNYLLDKQIKQLENDFVKNGGIRERMYNVRLKHRNKN
jgi:four helix bundle suffix protein